MQHPMNFICFSFPRALQLPSSEGGKPVRARRTVSHNGGSERQKGRKQEAGFVGKTLETPRPQISSVSLRHDWGLIFKCNSKQYKWALSNLRNQTLETSLCLSPYTKCPVRLSTVSHAECDMPETLRQRSLGQSHIHEQRSHRTTLALWD